MTATQIDIARIRAAFPALAGPTVYLENAGGSQMPAVVADAIHHYMLNTYVQLEAGYAVADACDAVIEGAHAFVDDLVNGGGTGAVILGPSTSQLVANLAASYAARLEPGDEVVVAECGHEANIGPWAKLADRGVVVRTWRVDRETGASALDDLAALLTPRTRVVAVVHVSNLLGEILDVAAITRLVHDASPARVVVDGVAFAPHRAIDVQALGVDWYVFSTYKVYGPHMAALYGRHDAVAELTGPNHFFVARDDVPYKFELGGVNHEGCAGVLALAEHLAMLAGMAPAAPGTRRDQIVAAYETMIACEEAPLERLLEFLRSRPSVRIVGPADAGPRRVGTVSFVHDTLASCDIAARAHARSIGIRHGHMYAHRLCEAMGIEPEDGVVRVSLVHYNTVEEIDRLVGVLDAVL